MSAEEKYDMDLTINGTRRKKREHSVSAQPAIN